MTGAAEAGGIEAARREIDEISAGVGLALRTVRGGDMVELSGLERRTEALCAAVGRLPEADAAALRPSLLSLIDDLGHLTAALVEQRDQTRAEIGGTNSHSAAAAAYRQRLR